MGRVKTNSEDKVWGPDVKMWKEVSGSPGLQCSGNIQIFLKHSKIRLLDPLKLSPFISYTNCYGLQSMLKVNSFLFPSESENSGLSIMVSPGLLPVRVPKKLFAEWPNHFYFWWYLGNDRNLNDFTHFFVHSCIHLFPSENKPGLCK